MKVLLVNKFHYRKGGSETYYFTLAEALKAKGHDVIFFAMKDEENNLPCEQEEYFVSNASVQGGIKSKLNMVLHITYSKEAYVKMKKLLENEKPDLIILNLVHKQITLSIIDAIKEFDSKVPIFWTMHDLIAVCPSYSMRDGNGKICEKCMDGNFKHCVENRCIKGSYLMSVLSKYEAEYIRRKDWYNKIDLFICPSDFYRNKLQAASFTSSPIVTMRNPLPMGVEYEVNVEHEGYILYFGRLSPEKGVDVLIEAAQKSACHLVIVGTGPQEAELKESAKEYPNIEFVGYQTGETLKNYIRNSLCVVMPSTCYENGPYSAMEAMSLGKPLIVSDNGGLPELVEEGKNGYIYSAKADADGLSGCIHKMNELSEEEYDKMAHCSMNKAKELFEPMKYVEEIEKYYNKEGK